MNIITIYIIYNINIKKIVLNVQSNNIVKSLTKSGFYSNENQCDENVFRIL